MRTFGAAGDKAAIGNFFALLQENVLNSGRCPPKTFDGPASHVVGYPSLICVETCLRVAVAYLLGACERGGDSCAASAETEFLHDQALLFVG